MLRHWLSALSAVSWRLFYDGKLVTAVMRHINAKILSYASGSWTPGELLMSRKLLSTEWRSGNLELEDLFTVGRLDLLWNEIHFSMLFSTKSVPALWVWDCSLTASLQVKGPECCRSFIRKASEGIEIRSPMTSRTILSWKRHQIFQLPEARVQRTFIRHSYLSRVLWMFSSGSIEIKHYRSMKSAVLSLLNIVSRFLGSTSPAFKLSASLISCIRISYSKRYRNQVRVAGV